MGKAQDLFLEIPTGQVDALDPPRRLSEPDAGGCPDDDSERLVQLLDPATEAKIPALLSGARGPALSGFLEKALEQLSERKTITQLVVFTPQHAEGPLRAQLEAFLAMFPDLDEDEMKEMPPGLWSSMVKAEMGKQSPKRVRRVIVVDRLEEIFDEGVGANERVVFLKNLSEIAQSFATSVLMVVDHRMILACAELPALKASLGSRFHVRAPGSPSPAKLLEIVSPEPIRAIRVPEPKLDSAPDARHETEAQFEEPVFDCDPVPLRRVATSGQSFWKQMAWVWAAGHGVALIMIAGIVVLATSIPDRVDPFAVLSSEVAAPEARTGPVPPSNLTPVSAAAAIPPVAIDSFEGGLRAGEAHLFGLDGLERNQIHAADLLLPPALAGDPRAMYLMGVCRLHGEGVRRDYDLARDWFRQSIAAGGIEAYQEMAMMKERGVGERPDRTAAARIYRDGAEAGNRFCMEKCADLLASATGAPAEHEEIAAIWRERAQAAEDSPIQRRVRSLAPGLYR